MSKSDHMPLAERLRPQTLEDMLGQPAALKMVAAFVGQGHMPSVVFCGPPGTGKTTLSRLLARLLDWESEQLNATSASVKEIRAMADQARSVARQTNRRTLLFIDEIHRLNRGRQEVLLPFVEDGVFVLAGSTTENPAFALNRALRSRVQVIELEALDADLIHEALRRALPVLDVEADDAALAWIAQRVSGDLRIAYTTLEAASVLAASQGVPVGLDHVGVCLKQTILRGDGSGDNHFDLASAFQKSLRGSDADAAIYYLARFLASGEDPLFIARRLLVTAAEDVGNADPKAFLLASDAFRAVEVVGLPEARIPLAQATIYVARAPKSRQSIDAVDAAGRLLKSRPTDPIPIHLRQTPWVTADEQPDAEKRPKSDPGFLPDGLAGRRFCDPQRQQPPDRNGHGDLQALCSALRQADSGEPWFEVDADALAEALNWPVKRVKQRLNELVQTGRLRFKRVFRWPDDGDEPPGTKD